MVAHQAHENGHVGRDKAHARRDALHELDADLGVIAGVALAQVVQPRPDQQQVGAAHAHRQRRRFRGRLQQVPIYGETVIRVVLRTASHRFPFGKEPRDESELIERFEGRDRTRAGREQLHERVGSARRPGVAGVGDFGAQPLQRRPADRRSGVGRSGGHAQRKRWIRQHGVVRDDDFGVAQHHPGADHAV